ncbi:MAG: tetratricopeptide repeat protein [Oleiphilaceae bacterium]|nr:tetratricopeptide repeat protein [Oleiphilaceae bacterium]
MEELRTEEEQIAAIKKWWQENGNSLLIGVGAALAIVFGWKAWQNSAEQEKAEASILYQQLITTATNNSLEDTDESSSVGYIAGELKEKYEGSEYAIYGALFMAKDAVENGQLDVAAQELEWVTKNTEDARLQHIAKGRLARVLSAQGKHDEALAVLNAVDSLFEANYLEIKGDIYLRKQDEESAKQAYLKAYEMVKDSPQSQPLLAVKLSDLGVNPDTL